GGIVSLILARDHPDVVDRLMVVDVPAFFSVLINPFATAGTVAPPAQAPRRSYLEKSRKALEDELRPWPEKLGSDRESFARIVRWGIRADQATTADVMAEVMVTDLRADMARIQCPVDVIYAWDKSSHATRMSMDQIYASAYAGLANARKI